MMMLKMMSWYMLHNYNLLSEWRSCRLKRIRSKISMYAVDWMMRLSLLLSLSMIMMAAAASMNMMTMIKMPGWDNVKEWNYCSSFWL